MRYFGLCVGQPGHFIERLRQFSACYQFCPGRSLPNYTEAQFWQSMPFSCIKSPMLPLNVLLLRILTVR